VCVCVDQELGVKKLSEAELLTRYVLPKFGGLPPHQKLSLLVSIRVGPLLAMVVLCLAFP
jgi:hypothetical protein